MKQSVRLGRVGGIPVGAHWSVAVILALITELLAVSVLPAAFPHKPAAQYWVVAVIAAAAFLACLLAHELAHALVARRSGIGVRSITLWLLGGVAELDGDPPDAGADLRIALAGPAASLLAAMLLFAAGVAIAAAGGPGVAIAAAIWLALMNMILAVFNLLPGAPLDGGRVLRAVLWHHYRDRARAERAAARSGRFLGALVIGLGLSEAVFLRSLSGLWLMLIGWFLISAATGEEQAAEARTALAGLRVADVMTPDPELAPGWVTVEDFIHRAAAGGRPEACPVVGLDGGLAGVLLASQLARVPARDRARLRLDQVAMAVPASYQAAPEDPAGPLLTRRPLGDEVAAVVLADGRVTAW